MRSVGVGTGVAGGVGVEGTEALAELGVRAEDFHLLHMLVYQKLQILDMS